MPLVLSYTNRALADIEAARRWLTQPGSGPLARRRLAALWSSIEALREHPRRFPVGPHRGVREMPCDGGYRLLYRVVPDTAQNETAGEVRVLRVFGPGQNRQP